MKKLQCKVCGKPSRGSVCRSCIRAAADKRKENRPVCQDCGNKLAPMHRRKSPLCRSCLNVRRRAEKLAATPTIVCVRCGKSFQSMYARWQKDTRYCSRSCISLDYHEKSGWSKEKIEQVILEAIEARGTYMRIEDVRKELHISDKSIFRFGLSIPQLNFQAGTGPEPVQLTREQLFGKAVAYLKEHGYVPGVKLASGIGTYGGVWSQYDIAVSELHAAAGVARPPKWTKASARKAAKAAIKAQGQYCGVARVLSLLRMDHASWVNTGLDIVQLNASLGFTHQGLSWFEERAWRELTRVFGDAVVRQARFSDCLSPKGRRLRFDFCIGGKALIEIDGEQHYVRSNKYHTRNTQIHDEIKNAFAKAQHIPLYRIRCTPSALFERRLSNVIGKVNNGHCKTL